MELLEAILGRRSIRRFQDKEVADEQIGELLTAFKWAPSAGNRQPWEVIVVRDEEIQEELAEIALDQTWMTSAPVIFVVCVNEKRGRGHYGERGEELYAVHTTGAAIQNLLLRAEDMGLATCWVGAFDEEQASTTLECGDWVRPVAMIPVGYPAERKEPPARSDITDFTYTEKFGKYEKGEWKGLKKYAGKARRKTKKLLDSLRKY